MSVRCLHLAEDAWKLVAFPAVDVRVVAFPSPPLRLLAGPAQACMQEATDVVGMIGDTKPALDQGGNAAAGPQFVGPAVGLGPLEQESFQDTQLGVGQARLTSGSWFGGEAARLLLLAEPMVEGNAMYAEKACDDRRGFALVQKVDSMASPSLQLQGFW